MPGHTGPEVPSLPRYREICQCGVTIVTMPASATGSRTVLLATGDGGVRDRFSAPLRDAGHRTLGANGAPALLQQLRDEGNPIDLLLLDLRLAGDDSASLLHRVRACAGGLPVVVFSGSVRSAAEVRALAPLGVAGYVNEHCDAQEVLPSLTPHLFPDNFNRRSSPRIVLAIPVSYRVDQTIATAVTLNLGTGGLAVRTMNPLRPPGKVHTRFRLPGSALDIEALCRVAWSDPRVGMGLQFERVDPADQTAIDDYVDQHQENASTTGRDAP